jgi:uncharacterized NAD(P)/FAD-binding protein YdhS
MAAAQLLRGASQAGLPLNVALIERKGAIGEGVAYGTRDPAHLLNVPAGRMSAWADRPDDFVQWASQRFGESQSPRAFLPRLLYGEYIRETLLTTARQTNEAVRLSVIYDEVRRVARHPAGGWMVHLARGASMRAEAVVLALGHRPPVDPIGPRWHGPRTRLIADPWRPFATNVINADEPVVVLGSGLTAMDCVLSLSQQPRQAPITLISRRGLLPQAHATAPLTPADLQPLVAEMVANPEGVHVPTLLRKVRGLIRELARPTPGRGEGDWRVVVDGLRPHTETLWRATSIAQRRKFLRHVRPFWESFRHRMPSSVAEKFRMLMDHGDVRLIAGRVELAQADNLGKIVRLILRERGTERLFEASAAWVINCTGPMPSNSVESNPVIGSLVVSGLVRPDELALGVETSPGGNAVAEDGCEVSDLFVVGTLRKPASWESTAVPELRNQAASVADRIIKLLVLLGRAEPSKTK